MKKPSSFLLVGFILIAFLLLVILYVSVTRMSSNKSIVNYIYYHSVLIGYVHDIRHFGSLRRHLIDEYVEQQNSEKRNNILGELKILDQQEKTSRDAFNKLNREDIERILLEEQDKTQQLVSKEQSKIMVLMNSEQFSEAHSILVDGFEPLHNQAMEKLGDLANMIHEENTVMLITADENMTKDNRLIIKVGIASLLFCFIIGVYVIKKMKKTLRSLENVAEQNKVINLELQEEINDREHYENKLELAQAELENRVVERTNELRDLNQTLMVEVDERKRAQDELQYKATHDDLTALANRALFYEQLELIIEQSKRHKHKVALFYLDLDGFKQINDTLGHDYGDKILIEVARRLKQVVRKEDIVARLGGDEFSVIFGHLDDEEHITMIANKVIDSILKPFELLKQTTSINTISASIGISIFPFDCDSADSLVKNADVAMYKAKQECKGKFVYFHSLNRASNKAGN